MCGSLQGKLPTSQNSLLREDSTTTILSRMEEEKFVITVSISGMPDTALYRQTKIKGSARVHLMPFDVTLNWIPWAVTEKRIKISWPGYTRIVEGKYKVFPSISFTDKKLDKLVCRAIKNEIEAQLEVLKAKAQEEKKKKKEEAKRKQQLKKFSELRVFFSLSKKERDAILWGLWEKSYREKKPKNISRRDKSDWRYQADAQNEYVEMLKKSEAWITNRKKQMRENYNQLKKLFEESE